MRILKAKVTPFVDVWSALLKISIGALLCLAPAAWAERVHIFLPTDRQNPEDGRSDALRIELRNADVSEIPAIVAKYQSVLPKFDYRHPPVVPIYLSHSTPAAERTRLVAEGKRRLAEAYPGLKIKFQIRYLSDSVETETQSASLAKAAAALPLDAQTARALEILKQATREVYDESIRNELPALSDPATARKVVKNAAIAKAGVTLAGRVGQLMQQGVTPEASAIAAAIGLVGGDTALSYYATKYETAIGNFLSKHPLPIWEREGVLSRIRDIYKNSYGAQMIKGTVGNVALWGVGTPTAFQAIGHYATGTVPLPTWDTAGHLAWTSLVSSGTYVFGFNGFEKLRQKGWIHQPAVDLILRGNGFLWTINSLLLSTGDPRMAAISPLIMGPMWGIYGTPGLLGPLLPAKNDRLILLDPNLKNRADLDQIEALEKTLLVESGGMGAHETALAKAREAKLIRHSVASRLAGVAAQTVLNAGARCLAAFSRAGKTPPAPAGSALSR